MNFFSKIETVFLSWRGLLPTGRSRGRIPVGGEIFSTRSDRPWGPRSLPYSGYPVIPGAGRGVNHLP